MVEKRIREEDGVLQTAFDKSRTVIGDEFNPLPKTGCPTSKNDEKDIVFLVASTDDMVKVSHAAQNVDNRNIGKTNSRVSNW